MKGMYRGGGKPDESIVAAIRAAYAEAAAAGGCRPTILEMAKKYGGSPYRYASFARMLLERGELPDLPCRPTHGLCRPAEKDDDNDLDEHERLVRGHLRREREVRRWATEYRAMIEAGSRSDSCNSETPTSSTP